MGVFVLLIWLLNFFLVFFPFAIGSLLIPIFLYSTHKKYFFVVLPASLFFSVLVSVAMLYGLVNTIDANGVYKLTAFSYITWRPILLYLAIISAVLFVIAHTKLRTKAISYVVLSAISLTGSFAGLIQASVGLFYADEFFNYFRIPLHY